MSDAPVIGSVFEVCRVLGGESWNVSKGRC